jgi:ABC-type transport system involved in multi-copper enzyme maturation permease subunit
LTKNRFLMNLSWELENLFRFPFPELLLGLFTVMVFLPKYSGSNMSGELGAFSWQRVTHELAWRSAYQAAFYSLQAYLPIIILASIFATMTFAYEIENGLLKVHLSHPSSRRSLFASKWLACFLIVFTTLSCTLLLFNFLYLPQNNAYLVINIDLPLKVLAVAASEAFFVVSLTVSFSIFSRKASVSLVGSFATLYIIQLASQTTNLVFLPPASFYQQVEILLSSMGPKLSDLFNFLTIPLISVFLMAISYIYFSRRLEMP